MATGQWIVVAVDTTADDIADHMPQVAGPFPDRDEASKFATDADGDRLVVHVTRMYSRERGADEFAISDCQRA